MLKWKLLPLASFAVTLALAGSAFAGSVYRWTTEDGSVAYSDDAKRIPPQYRSSAKVVRTGDLGSYGRYTPAETRAASQERTAQLRERIERLRELNQSSAHPVGTTRVQETSTILRLDDRSSITIPHSAGNEEPVIVEEKRVRDRNNISTTHVTVVRQGDEILSVVRPESAHDRADWKSERELLGDE